MLEHTLIRPELAKELERWLGDHNACEIIADAKELITDTAPLFAGMMPQHLNSGIMIKTDSTT
jgi:hypothetical protein